MANSILAKMAVQISANTAEFGKGINQANASLKSFGDSVKQVGAAVGIAFSVREISSFVLEANKLAGTFEGVARAFDRLPNSTLLMNKLKESTHGTVGELELMQQALRAKNFGISVKDLGTYLEFAAIRAQQTGESIDYMVNSIILGLGRGSIKILDNLQVNIAKIKETVKETGVSLQEAFRQQVLEQMQTIGGYAETSATQVDRLTVAFQALRLEISRKFESSDFIKSLTDTVNKLAFLAKAGLNPIKAAELELLDEIEKSAVKSAESITKALKGTTAEQSAELDKQLTDIRANYQTRKKEIEAVQKAIAASAGFSPSRGAFTAGEFNSPEGVARLREFIKLYKEQGFSALNAAIKAGEAYAAEIQSLKERLPLMEKSAEKLNRTAGLVDEYRENLVSANVETGKQLGLIEQIKQAIENEEAFRDSAISEKSIRASNIELVRLNKELDRLLGKLDKDALREAIKFVPPKDSMEEIILGPSVQDQFNVLKAALAQIGSAFDIVEGKATQAFTKIEEGIDAVAEKMIDVGPLISGGIADIANAIGEAAFGGENFGQAFIKALARFAQQFGSLLIATGIGELALQSGNPALMIAGGAALVAAGAAISSLMSNKPSISGRGRSGSSGGFTRPGVNNEFQDLSFSTSVSGTNLNIVIGNTATKDSFTKPQWR
jgi:hypothetical protein